MSVYPAGLDECRGADGKLDMVLVKAWEARLEAAAADNADTLVVLRRSVLACQVCARKDLDATEVARWTNLLNPAGTTHGWQIDEAQPAEVCAQDAERLHWVLVC